MDRSISIFDPTTDGYRTTKAYGPLYTKVLARWRKDPGFYVKTNGRPPAEELLPNDTFS